MPSEPSSHRRAVLQALFVTFLWSTSWVLIKIGLRDALPALTFAGLRYGLAFLCLLPFVALRSERRRALQNLPGPKRLRLALLGLLFYAATQGAQFVGLATLPAATVSLLLNVTTVLVALLGIIWLAERPTRLQWGGIGLSLAGILTYFTPLALPAGQTAGLIVTALGVLANALSALLGRRVNREGDLDPLTITTVSMGIGALVLLGAGFARHGLPPLDAAQVALIAWLAVVNTAVAFTLWNHTLRTLTAAESSILNSTMLIQIALLAWWFLGEGLTARQGVGLALAGTGALIVSWARGPLPKPPSGR